MHGTRDRYCSMYKGYKIRIYAGQGSVKCLDSVCHDWGIIFRIFHRELRLELRAYKCVLCFWRFQDLPVSQRWYLYRTRCILPTCRNQRYLISYRGSKSKTVQSIIRSHDMKHTMSEVSDSIHDPCSWMISSRNPTNFVDLPKLAQTQCILTT